MTSAFPSCSLVSPYFPDPSVARANTAASKIDAWSAYATLSLDTTPGSGPSSPTLTDGDYLGHFQDLQDRQHDVTATGNSSFHFHLQNPGHATANNGKEYPTCFAPTSALFHRDKTVVEEPDTADKLHQILNNLKIRCHTDVYKNPSSPDVSNTGETQSNPKISTPLSLSTQPRSLCAYNRQVYDATRSLYGAPSYRPTQMQHQYATSGNAPFLTGSRYLTDVADDYSPGMLSPQMVSNLENLISSPAPRSTQQMYEQLNEQHMDHKSGQLEGNYAWYLSQNRMENALHTSGNSNPDSGPYYGRPSSSTSDGSTSTLSSPERGPGKQRTATVMHGSNPTAWGFDTQAYLIDPIDGKHYGIAEEILAQQHAYPASFAPLNIEENIPASHSQVFHNIGSYTDAQQQAIFAPNHQIRTNRNLNSLAISTSGLNAQMSSSMTPSPLSTRRGSFDGDLSVFNSKSAVFGGPFQVGSRSYTQSPHQRRHSVSSNPPLSAASSSSSTAGSMTNQSSTSGGTASVAGSKEKKVSLYKTELCRSFEETGSCRYGSKCQFAHGQEELRTVERHPKHKSVMCKTFWEQGSCPYGQRCCFIHTAVPSDRGTVSIQSRAQFQSAPASGTSHSLPAKPPTVASSAIPTGIHNRQPSASLSTLYPVEDDAVINAINVTVDTSKLAKGLTTPSIPARTTSPTADKSTFGSAVVGSSSMQHRLRRASLGDAAEDVGATLNYKNKKSRCACTRIGGVGSCFSCSANVAKMHNHSRARTITSGELAYQQQQLQLQQLQQQQQQQPGSRTARRSSLTEGGARRLPIFQSIQS